MTSGSWWGWPMNANLGVKVKEVVSEGKGMTTLRFDLDRTARPGQFVMVWVPGVDEVAR